MDRIQAWTGIYKSISNDSNIHICAHMHCIQYIHIWALKYTTSRVPHDNMYISVHIHIYTHTHI